MSTATSTGVVVNQTFPSTTDLAVDRTRLAHERTLMAWIRTSASLISFGFTIHKFFQYLHEQGKGHDRLLGPREFGLMMIGIGLVVLLLATIQHHRDIKALRKNFPSDVPFSQATIVSALISILGILAFLAVLLRQ